MTTILDLKNTIEQLLQLGEDQAIYKKPDGLFEVEEINNPVLFPEQIEKFPIGLASILPDLTKLPRAVNNFIRTLAASRNKVTRKVEEKVSPLGNSIHNPLVSELLKVWDELSGNKTNQFQNYKAWKAFAKLYHSVDLPDLNGENFVSLIEKGTCLVPFGSCQHHNYRENIPVCINAYVMPNVTGYGLWGLKRVYQGDASKGNTLISPSATIDEVLKYCRFATNEEIIAYTAIEIIDLINFIC